MRPVGFSDAFTEFEDGEAISPIMDNFQEAQMARNNHQESETARAGVREATDRAEDVVQTGIEAARRVAEEFGRVLGVGGQNGISLGKLLKTLRPSPKRARS